MVYGRNAGHVKVRKRKNWWLGDQGTAPSGLPVDGPFQRWSCMTAITRSVWPAPRLGDQSSNIQESHDKGRQSQAGEKNVNAWRAN
jgi:hypothetical protein